MLPLPAPSPDARRFVSTLMGREPAQETPLIEYIVDPVVMRPVVTGLLGREWVGTVTDRASHAAYLDNFIAFWHRLGYDIVRLEIGMPFQENRTVVADAAPASDHDRVWVDQHAGAIASWEDFERYPWPRVEDVDFFPLEYVVRNLPEGMGFVTCHAGGVFEHLSQIMSIEGLCVALCEQPDLVRAVADRVGESLEAYYRQFLGLDGLAAVLQGDDMGFRTGMLIPPDAMRAYCLPWLKRLAALTHDSGRPFFLHSCGNIFDIIEDLIEDVRIDGKHSFEDAILPIERFQARYGDRIAVLGGVDINILSAGTEEDVRRRTRELIETCGARGRFAVGSGNSIPSYVPVANYLAMVEQAVAMR